MSLARCPMCGATAAVKRRSVGGHYMYRVECSTYGTDEICRLTTDFYETKDEAVDAWVAMAGEGEPDEED